MLSLPIGCMKFLFPKLFVTILAWANGWVKWFGDIVWSIIFSWGDSFQVQIFVLQWHFLMTFWLAHQKEIWNICVPTYAQLYRFEQDNVGHSIWDKVRCHWEHVERTNWEPKKSNTSHPPQKKNNWVYWMHVVVLTDLSNCVRHLFWLRLLARPWIMGT
jgi:hypothetical protein